MEYNGNEAKQVASNMKEIKVDAINWNVFYYDSRTDTFWQLDYPESGLQGGGAPRLRMMNSVSDELKKLID